MKNFYLYLITIFLVNNASNVLAYTGTCSLADGGTFNTVAQVGDFNVNASTGNNVGQIVTTDALFSSQGMPYKAKCDSDPDLLTNVYTTTVVPLPPETDGWYSVNDYLSIKTKIYINGTRAVYLTNPIKSEPNGYDQHNGNVTDWYTAGKGLISVRIDKRFVGFSSFNKLALIVYANAYKTGVSTKPLVNLYLSGSVTVPQNCEINNDQGIVMDFGNIGSQEFSQAGVGNKPASVNPQTQIIRIQCKNIDAQAMLSLRLEANNTSGNAMISDNKDVGFIVADGNNKPLTPNDINSVIKFQLNDDFSTSLPITAWPVSITGKKPAEGRFTAEGYLRIDFD